jgi:Mg2+ and Co2+ transporter CorA
VIAATVDLLYDDQYADVSHTEVFEAVIAPLDDVVTAENLHMVDHDPRDFADSRPDNTGFAILDEKIQNKTWWRDLESSLKEHLYRNLSVTVFKNPDLKLYSRIGESEADFAERCRRTAEDAADEAAAALRDKYEDRVERVKDQLRAAERRVDELEVDVSSRKQQEVLGGVGDLLGSLFGGKRTTTALKGAASRRSQVRRLQERLETAEAKAADKTDDITELEADLADDILEITSEWEDKAENIEPVEIGLEKTDIAVRELRLAWVRSSD